MTVGGSSDSRIAAIVAVEFSSFKDITCEGVTLCLAWAASHSYSLCAFQVNHSKRRRSGASHALRRHSATENADLIKLCLRNRDIKNPTLADLEDAYERQKALGLLDIKDHIVNRNEKRKAEARADQIEAERTLTEDELYAMPLNELARRARGW